MAAVSELLCKLTDCWPIANFDVLVPSWRPRTDNVQHEIVCTCLGILRNQPQLEGFSMGSEGEERPWDW